MDGWINNKWINEPIHFDFFFSNIKAKYYYNPKSMKLLQNDYFAE